MDDIDRHHPCAVAPTTARCPALMTQECEKSDVLLPIRFFVSTSRMDDYRRHPGQEIGRAGRTEKGNCHSGEQHLGPAPVVETERVAKPLGITFRNGAQGLLRWGYSDSYKGRPVDIF